MVWWGYIWLGFSLVLLFILVGLTATDGAYAGLFTNKTDDVWSAVFIGKYIHNVLRYFNTNQTLKIINIPQIIIAKPKKHKKTKPNPFKL